MWKYSTIGKNIWNSKHFWAESFLIRDAQLVSLQLGRLLGLLDSRLKKRLPDSCLVLISQRGMRSLGSGSIGAFELGSNCWRARTQTGRRQRLLSKPSGLPLWSPVSRDPGLGLTEQQCSVPDLPIQHHRTECTQLGSWESNYPHCLPEKGVLPFSLPKSEKMRKCFRNILH